MQLSDIFHCLYLIVFLRVFLHCALTKICQREHKTCSRELLFKNVYLNDPSSVTSPQFVETDLQRLLVSTGYTVNTVIPQ